jgi:protein tyrosine phosphatase (PTP) superfamily phosphohydrolase (DUF442 family)
MSVAVHAASVFHPFGRPGVGDSYLKILQLETGNFSFKGSITMYKFLLVLLAVLFQFSAPFAVADTTRPAPVQPIAVEGVPNLFRVAPNFYRSAQPTAEGFRNLVHRKGFRTVISLRAFHSDRPLTSGLALNVYDFPMHTWHIEQEDVVGALRALRISMKKGPTLVHCEHGADRTGLIAALYRILYQGWSREAAIAEMENGKFGFHDVWINIPLYIRSIDLVQLKKDVGV